MNALPKHKPAARSAAALSADIAALEKSLADVRRAESTARTRLPAFIAEGDESGIRDCRSTITLAPPKIANLVATLEQTREALKVAHERDLAAANTQTYRRLKQRVDVARADVEVAEDAIDACGKALLQARASLESAGTAMRESGLSEDPYLLRAKLQGLMKIRLHMESGGILGEKLTLDSDHQLRQSGAASLRRAAAEFHALALQRVRSALHIMREPE